MNSDATPSRGPFRIVISVMCMLTLLAVLSWSGVGKILNPWPATAFLNDLIYIGTPVVPRVIGAVECALALWLASGRARRAAALATAALFSSFAVVHVFAMSMSEPPSTCGCLGTTSMLRSASPLTWALLNAGLVAAAGVVFSTAAKREPSGEEPGEAAQ